MAKKAPLLADAAAAWQYLREAGGIQEDAYDEALAGDIRQLLQKPADPWASDQPLGDQLGAHAVSVEDFTLALLRAVQPYARMLSDICAFFERHGVRESNQALRLRFDFGKRRSELNFDLKHFREWLETLEMVLGDVWATEWDVDSLWGLANIFRDHWVPHVELENGKAALSADMDNFVQTWYLGRWPDALPHRPAAGLTSADGVIGKVWGICQRFLDACRAAARDQNDLRQRRVAKNWTDDGTSVMGWREETLARVCSDHWPATLLMGVQRWAEGCKALPIRERAVAAAECVGKAEKLIATRPKALQQVRMPQRILQNILALPIWDKRHELYACWALARLDGALAAHAPTLHHDDGVLKLRFQATHIATFDSLDGPHYVFSELRTPAGAPPKGKGRTANIQPDYRITRTTTGKPGPDTLLVLEVKQYAKASRANFVGAASDYAEGCPNARIVLVNYGGIPPSFAAAVPARHVARTVFIGGFRPYSPEDQDMEQQKLDEFMENVLAAIPLPMKTGVAGGLTGRSVLVIDVSGSMGDHLRTPMLADYVEKVLKAGKLSAVVAADTKVINSWPPDRFHASQLRHLNGGETQLGAALAAAHVELSTAIVITDSDGAEQLAGSDAMVLNVAEMASWPAC